MPTYEYLCSSCAHEWEEVQRITEAPLEICPECHARTARRQISSANFILKGGGWYADLYSSSNGKSKKELAGELAASAGDAKVESKGHKGESSPSASSPPAEKAPSTAPPASEKGASGGASTPSKE